MTWFKYSLQDEPIGQWVIKRNVDGKDKTDFAFDQNFMIKPGAKVRVSMTYTPASALHCVVNVIHSENLMQTFDASVHS